jgi:hypothetical protein
MAPLRRCHGGVSATDAARRAAAAAAVREFEIHGVFAADVTQQRSRCADSRRTAQHALHVATHNLRYDAAADGPTRGLMRFLVPANERAQSVTGLEAGRADRAR